jgi:hypothetical protein
MIRTACRQRPVRRTGLQWTAAALAAGLLVGAAGVSDARQLYRWVDEEGNVHYTDSLPPTASRHGHTELSESGVPIRRVEAAKTAEEIAREQELERLRQEQQALIEQQQAEDRVLLQTYRTVDDVIMVRDGKLSSVDVGIQVIKRNIRRLQDRWTELQGEAGKQERAGLPVGDHIIQRIDDTERAIQNALGDVAAREQQKQAIEQSFAKDLSRFRKLNDIKEPVPTAEEALAGKERPYLIVCKHRAECDRLWERAVAYLHKHATMPIAISGNDIEMTKPPTSNAELGLALSRIETGDNETLIFLDLQCPSYSGDPQKCRTERGDAVLNGFRAALAPSMAQTGR